MILMQDINKEISHWKFMNNLFRSKNLEPPNDAIFKSILSKYAKFCESQQECVSFDSQPDSYCTKFKYTTFDTQHQLIEPSLH